MKNDMRTWIKGCPPKDEKTYLLKYQSNIVCSGRYRSGKLGEPQITIIAWRCDCCGRFATPEAWSTYE